MTEHAKKTEKKETVTIKKETLWMTSTFVLLAVVIILVILMLIPGNPTGGSVVVDNEPSPTPTPSPQPSGTASATADDDAVLGDENAPVTLVEFSDYQCPFCARFWSQTLPQIKSEYIETGQVKLVYRDFPLDSIHPSARIAAIAAECVREQGGDDAYFEYHDTIFQNQQALSESNLKQWASEMGYDIGSCVDNREYDSEVSADLQDAQAAGGRGTPFFVVLNEDGDGIPLSGAQPFSSFKAAIDSQL